MKKHIGEYVLGALLFCYLFSSFLEFKGTFILFLMIIVITPFVLIGRYKERKAVENYDNNKIDIKKDKLFGEDISKFDVNNDGYIMISEIYPLTEEEVINKITEKDKGFDVSNFKSYVNKVFNTLMKGYHDKNVSSIRPYVSNSLYYQDKCNIEEYINNNITRCVENIWIKGIMLKDYKIEGSNEIIVVALTVRIKDYFKNDVDDSIIIGNNRDSVVNTYLMTFIRKKERCKSLFDLENNECPNCGANLSLNEKGVCDYCHTSLVLGDYYWVLVDVKNIKL